MINTSVRWSTTGLLLLSSSSLPVVFLPTDPLLVCSFSRPDSFPLSGKKLLSPFLPIFVPSPTCFRSNGLQRPFPSVTTQKLEGRRVQFWKRRKTSHYLIARIKKGERPREENSWAKKNSRREEKLPDVEEFRLLLILCFGSWNKPKREKKRKKE